MPDHFETLCTKELKVKKMSVLKTEGKSFLFHIGNEFRNMISVTSEVDFYVEGFFGRFSLTRTQ